MIDPATSELHESNDQVLRAWERYVASFPARRIEELRGVRLIHSGTSMPFMNIAALTAPTQDLEDLEGRVRAARERAEALGQPWMMLLCHDYTPGGGGAAVQELLERNGLHLAMRATGMVTDTLAPPRRGAPVLELRRIADEETRAAISDLNCVSYDLPVDLGRETFAAPGLWGEGAFGRVGFVDGKPVSCAATFLVDGRLYVALVATADEHRRKGYAEAVMRSSLADAMEATGLRRTVLHASDIGLPVYEAMGYRTAASFGFYASAH